MQVDVSLVISVIGRSITARCVQVGGMASQCGGRSFTGCQCKSGIITGSQCAGRSQGDLMMQVGVSQVPSVQVGVPESQCAGRSLGVSVNR